MKEEILKHKAKLVIVSEEASERTKDKFKKLCLEYNVPLIEDGKIEELSKAIGKENKATFAVKESNLAKEIEKIYNGGEFIG
ncbi:MAG: ribosomal L7Ae/L30e/S12e/Gadd45 family protein [Clostridia bacterium]|nr:ribosomal L7Ae/L30e/S12e/Gadd45 family protein [Clostridia bacterium]